MNGSIVGSYVVPVHPHPLLVPEQNEGWSRLRTAFDEARDAIKESGADPLIKFKQIPIHSGRSWIRISMT